MHGRSIIFDSSSIILVSFYHLDEHSFHLLASNESSLLPIIGSLFGFFPVERGICNPSNKVKLLLLFTSLLSLSISVDFLLPSHQLS